MRNLWLAPVLAALMASSSVLAPRDGVAEEEEAQAGIEWESGRFDEILGRARAEGKPVMVDFYATWCGPCKQLDKVTYRDAAVVEFTGANLLCAKRDAEKDEGLELAKHHLIYNYPTILFLNPDGSEIDRHVGFLPPDEYLELMQHYLTGVDTFDDYLRRVEASPDDPELNLAFGEKLTHRLQRAEAHRHLEKAIALDPENERGIAVKALFALGDLHRKLATRDGDQEDWRQAVAYARRAIEEHPSDEIIDRGLHNIAYYNKKAGNIEAAAAAYRELVGRHPEDPSTLNAFAWFCAKQGHALEEATEKAKLAVEKSDGKAGLLDTLAEVYYARGMYEEAIATIQEAIAKEPEDTYLKDQLKKFQDALEQRAEI